MRLEEFARVVQWILSKGWLMGLGLCFLLNYLLLYLSTLAPRSQEKRF